MRVTRFSAPVCNNHAQVLWVLLDRSMLLCILCAGVSSHLRVMLNEKMAKAKQADEGTHPIYLALLYLHNHGHCPSFYLLCGVGVGMLSGLEENPKACRSGAEQLFQLESR